MTALQEAARDALEALEHIQRCIGFGTATIHQGSATWCQSDDAIKSLKAALAQQGEQQPVAWYEYNQDLNAWFLAYGQNPKAKTRPLVFGDTAAPAPQAQPTSGDYALGYAEGFNDACKPAVPQPEGYKLVPIEATREMQDAAEKYYRDTDQKPKGQWWWNRLYQAYIAPAPAPAPQAQDKSDNYLSGYCTGRTDLLKEQSARPVAQPLTGDAIWFLWASENGLEDCNMCKYDDFKKVFRYVENACGIKGAK